MVARINTVAFQGIDVRPVDVQVQIANGMPAFTLVGLPDKAVAESRERVRAALHALGISLPPKRLTVNLAPADLAKEGSHYDLPIALGVLVALEALPQDACDDYFVMGELGLNGHIRRVPGVLPSAMHAMEQDNGLICPEECAVEARWTGNSDVVPAADLLGLINHLKGTQLLSMANGEHTQPSPISVPDMADVKGQETARRALEIAAAGEHNMMMIGAPGAGKSMLASRLPGILPPLSPTEALETSMVHSLAGTLPDGGLIRTRPFRDPHHTASQVAMIGGGSKAKPGEISLAHNGVLFLDELPEFSRATLESLRQPIESGETLVARANHHVTYPAKFQLIAAMNPCRCGYLGDTDMECPRAPRCGGDYQAKISGPLLDRLDIFVNIAPVSIADLSSLQGGEPSAPIAARVHTARNIQIERIGTTNARIAGERVDEVLNIDNEARTLLQTRAEAMKLSARGYYRTLKVARTIADLAGADAVDKTHVAEALSFRRMAA